MEQIKAVQGNFQSNRRTAINNEFKQKLQIQVQFLQYLKEKLNIRILSVFHYHELLFLLLREPHK